MSTQNDNNKEDDKPGVTPADRTAAGTIRPAPARPRSSVAGRLARLLLLLIVLGGIAAAGWFGWQWLGAERARYDATLERQRLEITQLEERLARLDETRVAQDEFEALRDQLRGDQTALRDRLNAIAADMETLRDAAQGGRRDLLQSEVEYLLRIAADTLYLDRDVDTAIYALQAADDRLRELAEPRFMPVRQLIADHLRMLGAVNVPDVNGMALKLGSLMRQISDLPLRQAQHAQAIDAETAAVAPEQTAGWWTRVRAGFTRLFHQLVVVQRAEPPPPLLTPEQHFFLYRNVELQLAAARAALLAGDAAAYRQSLEIAREWLNRYFDGNDPAVANAIADISGLLDVTLQPALPDINPALERFRALTGNSARAADGARTG